LKKRGKKTTRKWLLVHIHEDLDKKKAENGFPKTGVQKPKQKPEIANPNLAENL